MAPTKRLFEENAYLTEFEAAVLSCKKAESGFDIVLDSTAFFPEGGGQFADNGFLWEEREGQKEEAAFVFDVREDAEGKIHHFSKKSVAEGKKVFGKIDWFRRFDFMQQHSGEHIFSGIAHSKFGAENVGFHLGLEETTVDLDFQLDEEQVKEIETAANEAVYKNLPVEISCPKENELENLFYRSKKKLAGKIRIVTVPGYDICACCGTHVKFTGEIGIIKVTSFQNYKGGTRLFMLCRKRAFKDYYEKNRNVAKVTNSLSVKPKEICLAVKKLEDEITQRKIYESSLKKELFDLKAKEMGSGERICVFEGALTPDELRRYCLALSENFKIAAVFAGEEENWKYAVSSKTESCAGIAKEINRKFEGKGGGRPELVQGGCKGKSEEIKAFFKNLCTAALK